MHATHLETIDISDSASPAQALVEAIERAAPGVKVVYARGWFLTNVMLANTARTLFEEGQVDLVQQRIRNGRSGKFAYLAIKRKATPRT